MAKHFAKKVYLAENKDGKHFLFGNFQYHC